ncbi:hypothetical protein CcCBS67573_g01087 [Chytriomyces confervae]|uniref:Non-structural maintenance of chromosomes element 1 homolog n=1 Tax=Chytriomyces confervae TaxID=246404 RepID=A0A507FMT9_9FUNG|nr:Non-structural maintenance of chromosomes element 1 [Chytriomyces hyalinus]TPX77644.1 hypothetical protein CcCBS67573_g01087 [Chytriomyces confervae]
MGARKNTAASESGSDNEAEQDLQSASLEAMCTSVTHQQRLFVHLLLASDHLRKGASTDNMRALHRHCCETAGVRCDPDQLSAFASSLNEHLALLDLELASIADPDTGVLFWALVNTSADQVSQLATSRTANDIAFIKRLIQLIMTADDDVYQISMHDALRESKLGKFTLAESEALIESLVDNGWFSKNENGWLTLGLRALMELKSYLRQEFEESVQFCSVCKEIITTHYERCGVASCPGRLHKNCARRLFAGSRRATAGGSSTTASGERKCPHEGCGSVWEGITPTPDLNGGSSNATRKRRAQEVDTAFFEKRRRDGEDSEGDTQVDAGETGASQERIADEEDEDEE